MSGRAQSDSGLSVDKLVAATIELLDEGGLDAFTMRSLGARLGCSAMAPYRYVDGREELLRRAVTKAELPVPDLGAGQWHERLERLLRDEWATTWPAQPWRIEVWEMGFIDPRTSKRIDATLAIYEEAGFAHTIDLAVLGHWSLIVGTLRVVRALRATSDHMVDANDDAIFTHNLNLYIAGLRQMVETRTPQRGGKRSSGRGNPR